MSWLGREFYRYMFIIEHEWARESPCNGGSTRLSNRRLPIRLLGLSYFKISSFLRKSSLGELRLRVKIPSLLEHALWWACVEAAISFVDFCKIAFWWQRMMWNDVLNLSHCTWQSSSWLGYLKYCDGWSQRLDLWGRIAFEGELSFGTSLYNCLLKILTVATGGLSSRSMLPIHWFLRSLHEAVE